MTQILLILFFVLLALSIPVAHAMLGGTAVALLAEGKPLAVIAQRLYAPTQSFPMLAVPYFTLAGSLMMHGKFGEYLANIARLAVAASRAGWGMCRSSAR